MDKKIPFTDNPTEMAAQISSLLLCQFHTGNKSGNAYVGNVKHKSVRFNKIFVA
jgi:hypothetical protein